MEKMTLWLADIRRLADCEEECMARLTPERRAQAERYKQQEDRLHCAAAGLLLRRVLGVRAESDLCRNEFGKPALAGEGPCFNLSHGGNYGVLALYHAPVGVDIEPMGERLPRVLSKRFLKEDELAWLEKDLTPERFAALWTRLESALKADGRGFGLERREFSVLESGQPWHLHTFAHDGHMISCAAEEEFQVELRELALEELMG